MGFLEEKNNYPEYIEQIYEFKIPNGMKTQRLDIFLTNSIANASRTKVQRAIANGKVQINGKVAKSSHKVKAGDMIICSIMKPPPIVLLPEDIPLDIVYEDEYLMVVNKPAGMVCHPAFGNRYGTLINAVLYHLGVRESLELNFDNDEEELDEGVIFSSEYVRPGLVHRLDKDTSGLIIITKNSEIHNQIASQFENRTISRHYLALAWGKFEEKNGFIIGDIARSPKDRKLFAVVRKGGKYAKTEYEVIEEFDYLTLLKLKLHTGRTHQIRVHLSHLKRPVFGDNSYGGDKIIYGSNNPKWRNQAVKMLEIAKRQMLHAYELTFYHPVRKENMTIKSDLPDDFKKILEFLK